MKIVQDVITDEEGCKGRYVFASFEMSPWDFFTEADSTPPNLSPTEVIEDDKTNPENDEKDNCNG